MVLTSSAAFAQSITGSSPDVYLVTIDTLRADHVHCYGDEAAQTPAMDAIARDGIRFARAFTPSPITNSAHTSILTGLLPSEHGVSDFGIPLATSIPTWAGLLKQNGYQTAAFIGAVVLDSKTLAPGLDRGFDFYDNFAAGPGNGKHWGRVERRGADVVHRAETWMKAHSAQPRFVWVHLYDPHDPYEPPAPFSQMYKDRLYDGEIAFADSALGQLFAYLKEHRRYNNALIVVVGDHGEGLGEHGEQTHGIFLYDATTHVPLLIKLPASPMAAKVVEAQVQTTDILPTVLDVLSITPPAALSKRSLRPYFAGTTNDERVVFGETDYPLRFGWAPLRAVRSGGYQFIEAPQPEFYDLSKDPRELQNTYQPWSRTVQHLRVVLKSSALRPPRMSVATGAASNKTLSELRALGYLGPEDAKSATNVPALSSLPDPKDKIQEQNLLHAAMISNGQGNPQEARATLEKLLEVNPDSVAGLRQLGELEWNAGEYRRAADHFARVVKAHPDDGSAALFEAKVLDKLGDAHAAQGVLEAVIPRAPGQFEARILLAELDSRLGDRAGAEEQLEAVLILNPANHVALVGLARTYLDEKRFGDVVDLLAPYKKDLELSHLLRQAYSGLGHR